LTPGGDRRFRTREGVIAAAAMEGVIAQAAKDDVVVVDAGNALGAAGRREFILQGVPCGVAAERRFVDGILELAGDVDDRRLDGARRGDSQVKTSGRNR